MPPIQNLSNATRNEASLDESKSSRHSKIVGTFGEMLLLYWFSKHGHECASVDHTGIDLIVYNRDTGKRMGISVKSRTRLRGKESDSINVDHAQFKKAQKACDAFGCEPYFAFVADAADVIRVFVLPMPTLRGLYPTGKGVYWKMTKSALNSYSANPDIMVFELHAKTLRWWTKNELKGGAL